MAGMAQETQIGYASILLNSALSYGILHQIECAPIIR